MAEPMDDAVEGRDESGMLSHFMAVTSAESTVARFHLEASGWDVATAVAQFFDGGAGPADEGMPDAGFGDETLDVRAPDQVKHQRLVGGFGDDADAAAAAYAAASQPAALAGAFADFSDEAADASPASDAPTPRPDGSGPPRPDTLATLYAAPRRLMFAGDFQAARQAGKQERKWLLVVITNDAVFKCHEMNRDVWTDETVQAVVEAQFILWFRQHVDTEAGTYTDRYDKDRVVPCLDSDGVETCHPAHPHLAVIDPRTGRRVWMREGALSAERVVELLGDVCDRYSLDDEPQALRVPSPAVRPQAARDLPPPAPLAPVAPPPPPADLTPPPWDSVVLVPERPRGDADAVLIQFKLVGPAGPALRRRRTFSPHDTVGALFKYAQDESDCGYRRFDLTCGFPPKSLLPLLGQTLAAAGLKRDQAVMNFTTD